MVGDSQLEEEPLVGQARGRCAQRPAASPRRRRVAGRPAQRPRSRCRSRPRIADLGRRLLRAAGGGRGQRRADQAPDPDRRRDRPGAGAARRLLRGAGDLAPARPPRGAPPQKVADGDFATPIPVDSSDELGQLARTFNEMQRRLADLDSARKQFIANASHELRTPIFSLGGFVELLEDEDPDPEARAEFVRTMREQVERLTKLTTDLLDLSKLDAGRDRGDAAQRRPRRARPRGGPGVRPAADRRGSRLEVRTPEPTGDRRSPTPTGCGRSSVSCSTTPSPTPPRAPR